LFKFYEEELVYMRFSQKPIAYLKSKVFERYFLLKNEGVLPVHITRTSIENLGCNAFGIHIINCEPFSLKVG